MATSQLVSVLIFILLKSKLVYIFKLVHALHTNSCESTHMIYCHTTENIHKAYLIKDLGMGYVKDAYNSITRRKTIQFKNSKRFK